MKILVRLSPDLTIKSDRVRAKFVSRMLRNINSAFMTQGIVAKVERQWSRLFVHTEDGRAVEVLRHIFGILSISVIEHECEADLERVVALATEAYADLVRGKSFAVRARRVGDHGYTSMDLSVALGTKLLVHARRVDLKSPEVEVHVEIRNNAAYLYSSRTKGAGGLPLGVSGKVLCLLSGGFDSAVAAWRMQRRGLEMDYIFCNLAGPAYERSVLGIAKLLSDEWSAGTTPHLHVLDFAPVVAMLRERIKPSHVQVLLKRMFYRVSERLAEDVNALALVTGECVAQVSSQTLRNLVTIQASIKMPVLRPLVGQDKEEIIAEARRIGTYTQCARVQEYCQVVPDKPVTACRIESAKHFEEHFDVSALVAQCLASRRTFTLRDVKPIDLVGPYIYTETLPEGAIVIDCRSEEDFAAWHHPGAINHELNDLMDGFRRFDKTRTYVLYCPVGLQSAVAAEAMQTAGYQAYSLKGGTRTLMTQHPHAPLS